MTRRSVESTIRIPRRALVLGGTAAGALVALAVLFGIASLARANEPVNSATSAQLGVQQAATERDIERAYEQATGQVKKVRALNLAISAAQADQIAAKALIDLRTLRHSALVSLAGVVGLTGPDPESYAVSTEQRLDKTPVTAQPSPSPVLLAPRFYTIVTRMSELATQLADQATTQLTAPAPSPAATPSTAPGSPVPSPSPSPTR